MSERNRSRIEHHYRVEKELASRLRNATADERRKLYTNVYDELFRQVPDHPMLVQRTSPEKVETQVSERIKLLNPFLESGITFLEVGPGNCSLALRVSSLVDRVFAVDVSTEITDSLNVPSNFQLILSDGQSIPVPAGSIDLAFSDQLMEHLHEEDAVQQLTNIFISLSSNGRYLCCTPSRMTGPHDISRYFDDEAQGFHLKEYTITELRHLFLGVGFSRVRLYVGARGHFIRFPCSIAVFLEWLLQLLPRRLTKRVAKVPIVRHILGIHLMGKK